MQIFGHDLGKRQCKYVYFQHDPTYKYPTLSCLLTWRINMIKAAFHSLVELPFIIGPISTRSSDDYTPVFAIYAGRSINSNDTLKPKMNFFFETISKLYWHAIHNLQKIWEKKLDKLNKSYWRFFNAWMVYTITELVSIGYHWDL